MTVRNAARLAVATLALLLCGTSQGAQDAAPQPDAAKVVTAIPAAEIPSQADVDERQARAVAERARNADLAALLAPRLEAIDRAARDLATATESQALRRLPAMRLESLSRHWSFHERQLERWRGDLQDIASGFTADAGELARRRAAWEATRALAREYGAASLLDRRVDSVLAQLAEAERALSGPLDEQLRLSGRAASVEARIGTAQAEVATAIRFIDERLLRLDAPPLWRLDEQPSRAGDTAGAARSGLALDIDFLRAYATANAARLVGHGLALLLLLPLLFWLRRQSERRIAGDEDLRASSGPLLRPVSAWLVLSLMSVLIVEPDAPILVHELAFLLTLVPVLRILPRRMFDTLGPWPYAATALYLLYHLSFLFVGHPVNHRLYLLALTLLTLATLVWLLLARRGAAPSGRLPRALRALGWASVGALAGSAAVGALGNVTLAEVITGGVLDSGYVGLALYAGVSVVGALLRLSMAPGAAPAAGVAAGPSQPLLQIAGRLVKLAALAVWVVVTLNEFRLYRPVSAAIGAVLTYPLEAGNVSLTLGEVLVFGVSVYVALWTARSIRVVLEGRVLPRMDLPRGVGNSIASLSYYALVLLGFVVALGVAGFEMSQLAIVVGALSVGIGFGLQNVVNNFVSGLILMFERPIRPGDVVDVAGTSGRVREIGMRATTVATFEGADVVVPNGALLSQNLINWTLSDMRRRIDVNVGVAYGTDPRRVIELLVEVARETPGVSALPDPLVLFTGFGASSLDFVVRCWTDDYGESVVIRSNLAVRVHDALMAAGIEIPFPQQDLHLRSVSPEARRVLQGRGTPDPGLAAGDPPGPVA
ncbi:MAG: mechanosensitive ion channel [Steroidobacteraceae bacterium]|jgi:small-conductance mechanosensitive channel|nr:mechanosensitive ion channel [Steroidobacteraceae bacterium]